MNKKHKIWQSHIPGEALAAAVVTTKHKDKNGKIKESGDIGFALRFWKRALKDAGTLQEFKERRYHTKKSQEKRVQKEKAVWFQKCQDIRDNE